jgi:hypothetical protein
MAFLYSSYIIIYAILNPILGKYIDHVYNTTGSVRPALLNTAAIQLTIILILVFLSTFIPKGSFHFNPILIDQDDQPNDIKQKTIQADKSISNENKQTNNNSDLVTYF